MTLSHSGDPIFIDLPPNLAQQIEFIQKQECPVTRNSALLLLVSQVQPILSSLSPPTIRFIVNALVNSGEDLLAREILVKFSHATKSRLSEIDDVRALANLCRALGDVETAYGLYEAALELFPQPEDQRLLFLEIAGALEDNDEHSNALEVLHQLLVKNPHDSDAHSLAIKILNRMNLPEDARVHEEFLAKQGLQLAPERIAMGYWAASKAGTIERQEELRVRYLAALDEDLERTNSAPFSILTASDDPNLLLRVHQNFSRQCTYNRFAAVGDAKQIRVNDSEKIRVVYLSPDFRAHAVSYLITDLVGLHDRKSFEIFGVGLLPPDTSMIGVRIQDNFDEFFDLSHMRTADIAAAVRALNPHIVVDLCGYTRGFRPSLFERFPQSLVVNYLGYPGTLGSPYHDYILGDRIVTPEGCDSDYSERVIRLPCCYQSNSPSRAITPVDFQKTGLPTDHFIFCSFNGRQKMNLETLNAWAEILDRCQDSILWLLDCGPSNKDILAYFGDKASRIRFAPKARNAEHLGRLKHAHLALDTFPYGAHTTASDALFAGVPTLARLGRSFQSRVSHSIMTHAGVESLSASSWPEYIQHAVDEYSAFEGGASRHSGTLLNLTKSHPYNISFTTACIEAAFRDIVSERRV